MTVKVPTSAVTVVRKVKGKNQRIHVKTGEAFNFTTEEIRDLLQRNPH